MDTDEIPDAVVERILSMKSKEPCTVKVMKGSDRWCFSEVKRVSTQRKTFSDILYPDEEFGNPKKTDVRIKNISLIPDDNFKEKGAAIITVNDSPTFRSAAGSFADVSELLIESYDLLLNRDNSVKVFLKSSDGTKVSLTVLVQLKD